MKPDRELDARVAENIMGWTEINPSVSGRGQKYFGMSPGCYTPKQIPHYSSDISAAWNVIQSQKWESWSMRWDAEEKMYYCQIQHHGNKFIGFAETAPEAVCVAALTATGNQK